MSFDDTQLDTLVAIIDTGTFDAAGRQLGISPSAVSQRIKALETTVGQVLIRRTTPCDVTPPGETLLSLGRRAALLRTETAALLGAEVNVTLAICIDSDSLSSWFSPALAEAATWPSTAIRIALPDEGSPARDQLRRADVVATVSHEPRPNHVCSVEALGSLRYLPVLSPSLLQKVKGSKIADVPVVASHAADQRHEPMLPPNSPNAAVVHQVPSSTSRHEAIRRSVGWGLLPAPLVRLDLAQERLVVLPDAEPLDVPLFWHAWRLKSQALDRLSDAVRRAAEEQLMPPNGV